MRLNQYLLLMITMLLPLTANAAVPTSDGWDNGDLSGWRRNTAWTNVSVVNSGGNVDGYLLSVSDPGGNPSRTIGALSEEDRYAGDFQTPNIKNAAVDLNLLNGSVQHVYLRFRYHDDTYNGWFYEITGTLNTNEWSHFSVTFDPSWTDSEAVAAGWAKESNTPTFSETMQDVYTTEIRVLSSAEDINDTRIGIDNFRIGLTEAVPLFDHWSKTLLILILGAGSLLFLIRKKHYCDSDRQ